MLKFPFSFVAAIYFLSLVECKSYLVIVIRSNRIRGLAPIAQLVEHNKNALTNYYSDTFEFWMA